jgi:NADH-quinone oxidoreductase subunit J
LSSLGIIFAKNPVQSVFYLILVYIFTAAMFSYLGADFIALLVFMVYVGAVSVLFLFCVMLLNLRYIDVLDSYRLFFPVGLILGFFFFGEIFFFFFKEIPLGGSSFFLEEFSIFFFEKISFMKSQLHNFGTVLYDYNWFFVILISILLLISMIGSIIFSLETFVLHRVMEKGYKSVFFKTNLQNFVFKNLRIKY